MTAKLSNGGEATATGVALKTALPKKLAKAAKTIRIPKLTGGQTVTKKIKVKVKKTAKRGKKLRVKVTASAKGAKGATAVRVARIR